MTRAASPTAATRCASWSSCSRRRAHAIAAWFKGRGLKIAIAYEGLGSSALLVKTGDQVDEPRNRRADYILALDPPKLPAQSSWKAA